MDTTTSSGKLIFGIFAALSEFERDLIVERTKAGLEAAKARGRKGGRPASMTAEKIKVAADMFRKGENVSQIARVLNVSRQSIYRHVNITDGQVTENV
jgi:DNA invertase Pin-like site-specific DNA recombinase